MRGEMRGRFRRVRKAVALSLGISALVSITGFSQFRLLCELDSQIEQSGPSSSPHVHHHDEGPSESPGLQESSPSQTPSDPCCKDTSSGLDYYRAGSGPSVLFEPQGSFPATVVYFAFPLDPTLPSRLGKRIYFFGNGPPSSCVARHIRSTILRV